MKKVSETLKMKLALVCADFIFDGYVWVGKVGNHVAVLRHPTNGNRVRLVADGDAVNVYKNGKLVTAYDVLPNVHCQPVT